MHVATHSLELDLIREDDPAQQHTGPSLPDLGNTRQLEF